MFPLLDLRHYAYNIGERRPIIRIIRGTRIIEAGREGEATPAAVMHDGRLACGLSETTLGER
jgi:hypothetical protein